MASTGGIPENSADSIRVMLVDDHAVVRAGISQLLSLASDISVVAEASDGGEAVCVALNMQPDVILMDLEMPVLDGVEATRRITEVGKSCVLMLTTFSDPESVLPCLRAGASGFLLKNTDPDQLVAAVRAAGQGFGTLSPEVTSSVVVGSTRGVGKGLSPQDCEALALLTDRERETLHAVAKGLSNQEIADQLFVGSATVKSHVSACLAKLHLRDRVQLAVFAHESGFMDGFDGDASSS